MTVTRRASAEPVKMLLTIFGVFKSRECAGRQKPAETLERALLSDSVRTTK
jgi:hypothetical protein